MLFGLASFGLWLVSHVGAGRPTRMHAEPVRIALAVFMVTTGISYALAMSRPISQDEISPADVALLAVLSWSGVLLVTHDGVSTRERMDMLTWRLALAGGLLAALGIVQFLTRQVIVDHIQIPGLSESSSVSTYLRGGRVRPSGTAIHPLEYGAILAIVLPIALHVALYFRARPIILRWLPALAIGAVIAISSSRTAYLTGALAVLIAAIGWTRVQRIGILILGGLGTAGLVALAPNLIRSVLNLFAGARSDPSVESRTDSFPVAWSFFSERPLFGRGLGTFLPKYRIFDNEYLVLLVSVGAVGTLAFLTLLGAALTRLIKVFCSISDASSRSLTMSLTGALLSGFASLVFFDAFAFPMTMGTIFLCLGLAGAASRLLLDGDHSHRFGGRRATPRRDESEGR
jgi:O-antigen ligase